MGKGTLIPQLDTYLDTVDIPNENTDGDGPYVSKEVDENGNPVPDQTEKRMDPYRDYMQATKMDVREVSTTWKEPTQEVPYCPVYAVKKPNGGRVFTAYIEGSVRDVDDYLDLADTLLTATEQDEYYIFIDSPGGMVAAGGLVASAIHHSKAKVMTIARGLCASAAALIHSSAKPGNAIVTPFAVMMYHMSSHYDQGCSTKIAERAQNQVRYVNECLLNKALADGHITQEEFAKIQNGEEIFISAEEFIARTKSKEVADA